MTKTCRLGGCERTTVGFSQWCSRHKARWRRHGAPDQKTIGKAALSESVERVKDRIAKNSQARIWQVCESRWTEFTALVERQYAASIIRHVREAAVEIAKLQNSVSPMQIITTTLAMYLLQAAQPNLIRSEVAFRTQLVRRVRSLTDANVSLTTSENSHTSKRRLKELSPRVIQVLGAWLVELFGPVGVWLTRVEHKEHEQKTSQRRAFRDALEEIK